MVKVVDLSLIEISSNRRNVRYDGRALDKCGIANLIHDLAFQKHVCCFPLWSDIYWFSSTKSELVSYLVSFM